MKPKIYIVPGMGASTSIYRGIRFPERYEVVPVEWMMPEKDEPLGRYVERMIERYSIKEGQVLAGMSFGGIIIHEMSRKLPPQKMIFISTVKTHRSFPPWHRWGRYLKIWNFLPYRLITNPLRTASFVPFKALRKRLELYEKYLSIRDTGYFQWAMKQIMQWEGDIPPYPYLHVHGTSDRVFPYRYLHGEVVPVEGAAHLALMTHPHRIGPVIRSFLAD